MMIVTWPTYGKNLHEEAIHQLTYPIVFGLGWEIRQKDLNLQRAVIQGLDLRGELTQSLAQ